MTGWRWLLWQLLAPLRILFRHTPAFRGKGGLVRALLIPVLPPLPAMFDATTGTGARIKLQYREALGLEVLLQGGFEDVEVRICAERCSAGGWFVDVGANVGFFTVSVAHARPDVTVLAIEPMPDTFRRLVANTASFRKSAVRLVSVAASDKRGCLTPVASKTGDQAYASLTADAGGAIQAETLDAIIGFDNHDLASVVKIDVEGAELAVLEGAHELLSRGRAEFLIEANGCDQLRALSDYMMKYGYVEVPQVGLRSWNHLFVHSDTLIQYGGSV